VNDPTEVLHTHTVRVYWEDTDAGGVVFYANYLKFFERARTEWLRTLGHSQEALRTQAVDERGAAMFMVADTQVRYLRPAVLDDALDITVELVEARSASLVVAQRALRQGLLLAQGQIKIACVNPHSLKPRRLPDALLAALPVRPPTP